MSKVPLKQPEHFWNLDLIEVSREWLSQIWTFIMTALTFALLSLPVIIAAFIMWYLAGFPRLTL